MLVNVRRGLDACALLISLLLGASLVSSGPRPAGAAASYADIASSGPLEHIYIDAQLACQFARAGDPDLAFFDPRAVPGDCGTFLVVDNVLYAPNLGDGATGSLAPFTPFTPISQTAVSGRGTPADPFSVVTTVAAGRSGIRIVQTDSYVAGDEHYRTDISVSNIGSVTKAIRLYRAADCYAAGSDLGYGFADPATGAVACAKNPNNQPAGRVEQFSPLTPADHYYEDYFDHVWAAIGRHGTLPDTCACDALFDNAIAISWDRTLAPGGSELFSVLTAVAPLPPPPPPPIVEPPPAPPPPPPPPEAPSEPPGPENPPPAAAATITTRIHDSDERTITSAVAGTPVHASIEVAGSAGAPSGTIRVSWYANGTCSGTALAISAALTLAASNGTTSSIDALEFRQIPGAAGMYAFRATYSGDGTYPASTGDCRPLLVTAPQPCDGDDDDDDRRNRNKTAGGSTCDDSRGDRPPPHRGERDDRGDRDDRDDRDHRGDRGDRDDHRGDDNDRGHAGERDADEGRHEDRRDDGARDHDEDDDRDDD